MHWPDSTAARGTPARRGVWALCLILEHWQAVEKMGGGPKVLFVVPQGRVQAGRVSNLLHLTGVDGDTSKYPIECHPSHQRNFQTDSHSAARKDRLCRMLMSTLGGSCCGLAFLCLLTMGVWPMPLM